MFNPTPAFVAAFLRKAAPSILAIITTVMGRYAYAVHQPTDREIGGSGDRPLLDGLLLLDGRLLLGAGAPLIDRGARVLNYSELEETLTPVSGDVFGGITSSEQTEFILTLSNADLRFSALLSVESFLAARLEIRLGFRGLEYGDFLSIWLGTIQEVVIDEATLKVKATA